MAPGGADWAPRTDAPAGRASPWLFSIFLIIPARKVSDGKLCLSSRYNKNGRTVKGTPVLYGGVDGTRTRDPRRDRPVF